jgi:hypothetical protein
VIASDTAFTVRAATDGVGLAFSLEDDVAGPSSRRCGSDGRRMALRDARGAVYVRRRSSSRTVTSS